LFLSKLEFAFVGTGKVDFEGESNLRLFVGVSGLKRSMSTSSYPSPSISACGKVTLRLWGESLEGKVLRVALDGDFLGECMALVVALDGEPCSFVSSRS